MRKVDVIVPVYGGLDETKDCILSAIQTIDLTIGQLIVINDASPEPELVKWLEVAAKEHSFTLLHNEKNLGFVATVNRGMQLNAAHDVLLLNSDVEVSGNWLNRMRDGAYNFKRVSSITPFSNNATICSFPNFCQDNHLALDLSVKEIDAHMSEIFSSNDLVEIPTGVGFCMYIRRDCLDEIGYFDVETFGKGYGEENDWCQRAEKAGWPNFLQTNVFVYHKGGVSFDATQEPRKAKALELLAKKHPDYDSKIQSFIKQDPIQNYRMTAIWKLFARNSLPKAVLVTHRLGGGVMEHLNELVRYFSNQILFLKISPLNDGDSINLSICDKDESLIDSLSYHLDTEYEQLVELLKYLGVGRIHFHHVIGLHPKIWSLAESLDCQYDFTIHDYYCVNGNPTLINGKSHFVGDKTTDEIDKACLEAYPIPVSAMQWRKNMKGLIEGAEHVIFPSADTHKRFSKYYNLATPIIAWHPDYTMAKPYANFQFNYSLSRPLKILTIGALSREKGADIVEHVAKKLAAENIEFHLLGYAYRQLDKSVITHGEYENSNVSNLIKEVSPDVVWLPAQWPETYSYTLSLALELGLPVVVPNIGAFSERVHNRSESVIMPWDTSAHEWQEFWKEVRTKGELPVSKYDLPTNSIDRDDSFYSSKYKSKILSREGQADMILIDNLKPQYIREQALLTASEKTFEIISNLSRWPVINPLVRLVPLSVKRKIKQYLTSNSLHNIFKVR